MVNKNKPAGYREELLYHSRVVVADSLAAVEEGTLEDATLRRVAVSLSMVDELEASDVLLLVPCLRAVGGDALHGDGEAPQFTEVDGLSFLQMLLDGQ